MKRLIHFVLAMSLLAATGAGTALLAPAARAWQPDGGTSYGTHQWIVERAVSIAGGEPAWLDLGIALAGADGSSESYPGFRSTAMGPGAGSISAAARVAYHYHEALAALAVEDYAGASRSIGALARWYTDLCQPMRAYGKTSRDRLVARYEADVLRATDASGEHASWVSPRSRASFRSIARVATDAAAAARASAPDLISSYRRSGLSETALLLTRRSLSRAANGMADIIVRLDKARLVDVRAAGATGDGVTDDTAALSSALAQASRRGSGLFLPAGTYRVSSLSLPAGLALVGQGSDSTWLRGGFSFRSYGLVASLKIGDTAQSTQNMPGASHTILRDCRFRGGGGTGGDAPVIMLGGAGNSNSLDHVTFTGCEVERNLGVEDWSGRSYGRGFNDITVNENAARGGAHVHHLKFTGCHVGVSNGAGGHDTGSPRAGLEVWSSRPATIAQGWHHIVVKGCTFETTDSFCIDLADFPTATGRHLAGPALIDGSVIKGAGWGAVEHPFGYGICLEAPRDVTISDNTIYAARLTTISGSYAPAAHTVITGNIIDLTAANDVTQTFDEAVVLRGPGCVFARNTVLAGARSGISLYLKRASRSRVAGNTFSDVRACDNPAVIMLLDASYNSLTGNLLETAADRPPRIVVIGDSHDNTITGNTFTHQ